MPLIPPAIKIPLPLPESIRDVLKDLLGRGVALDKTSALRVTAPGGDELATKLCVSVYHDKKGQLGVVTMCDLGLAEAAAAALVLTPATALAGLETRLDFGDGLRDNYSEVSNILASTFNTGHQAHLKFTGLYVLPEILPDGVWELIDNPGNRRDWTMTIEGYTKGRFSVIGR
jgi:predicted secreted protein